MGKQPLSLARRIVKAIRAGGRTIYDSCPADLVPTVALAALLRKEVVGVSLGRLPLRSRSKAAKTLVCAAMGYAPPASFKRTRPRFPAQDLDVFVQKADNLQVWNEDVAPERRYAVLRVDHQGVIAAVRVISGADLALLDKTGRLTQKHQARFTPGKDRVEIFSAEDSPALRPLLTDRPPGTFSASPTDNPADGQLLPIAEVARRLGGLIGRTVRDTGVDQERNRGAAVHALVCRALGFARFDDDGRFPDVRHQLLEVKLQTAPTIDLGLHNPQSEDPLPFLTRDGRAISCSDVRFAVFEGGIADGKVELRSVTLCTGADFHRRFPKFGGKGVNKKLQIPLPADFFSR